MADLADLFSPLGPVSLDAMNERAALQRRTDNKYLVPLDDLGGLVGELAGEHEVLEIDGERAFQYESTYFDTPSLRCFRDHVEDRRPRYKTRTRCYVTTGDCFFEVKVKREDGDTTKRHIDHDPDERGSIASAARDLLADVLGECGIGEPDDPQPSLVTAFERVTVVSRERPERTTFDFHVTLSAPGGEGVQLEPRYAIAETKTEKGDGAWDDALGRVGCEPISLSKYRVGTGLLHAPGDDASYAPDLKKLFRPRAAAR